MRITTQSLKPWDLNIQQFLFFVSNGAFNTPLNAYYTPFELYFQKHPSLIYKIQAHILKLTIFP